MKYKHGSNQYRVKVKAKYWSSVWCIAFFTLLGIVISIKLAPPIVSPCATNGCFVSKVEAAKIEESIAVRGELESYKIKEAEAKKPTIVKAVAYLAKTFENEGPQVIYEAISVGKTESGWRHDAKGWNCIYDVLGNVKPQKTEKTDVSKACKPEDRDQAWSVDCGIMQINVAGKECPKALFNPETNIQKAYEMYKRRGWQPWVAAKKLGYVN